MSAKNGKFASFLYLNVTALLPFKKHLSLRREKIGDIHYTYDNVGMIMLELKTFPFSSKIERTRPTWFQWEDAAHTAAWLLHWVSVVWLSGGFVNGIVICLILHREQQKISNVLQSQRLKTLSI